MSQKFIYNIQTFATKVSFDTVREVESVRSSYNHTERQAAASEFGNGSGVDLERQVERHNAFQ